MQPFNIPVQITLQGGRKHQGRTALPASGKRSFGARSDGNRLTWHPKLPSSAGEDRAMLLGITMMGSSVLMFLLLGTTVLKPSAVRPQREELNCTMVHTHIADDWLDCAFACDAECHGQGGCPCLRVLVNLTHSGQQALLHYDEEAIHTNPKCFYMPKCRKDKDDLLSSALDIKEFFDHKNGTPFACFSSPSHPGDVVLVSRSDQATVFHCLFWPSLTLLGGALIVGMVRLTQHLSLLCQRHSTARRAEAGGRGCSVGRLYGVARNRV